MKVSLVLAVAAAISGVSAIKHYDVVDGVYLPQALYRSWDHTDLKTELRPLRNDGKHLAEIDFNRLNLGLYFELMEKALFEEGLKKFKPEDWVAAGYSEYFHKLVSYMHDQEIGHAGAIQTILQGKGGGPCKYRFPFHDVKSFVDLCSQVTTVGEAGYLGFTWQLHNPENRLTSYQIFATEARQNAKFRIAEGVNPLNSFFDTPLTESQAYTLAAQFVEECPSENPPIPFALFPTLKAAFVAYDTLELKFDIKEGDEYGKYARHGEASGIRHGKLGHYGSSHDHDGSKHDEDKDSIHKSGSGSDSDDERSDNHDHDGSKHHKDGSHKSSSSGSGSDSDSNDEKSDSHDHDGSKHHKDDSHKSSSSGSGSNSDSNDDKKTRHHRRGLSDGKSQDKCCKGKSREESSKKDCMDDNKPTLYVAWINQIGITYTDYDVESGTTRVPASLSGATFVALTNSKPSSNDDRFVADYTIVAGPAFLPEIPGDPLSRNTYA